MKYYFLLLLFVSTSALFVQAQSDKTPYQTKSLTNEGIQDVKVETSGGSINVESVKSGDEKIEVYVSANNNRNSLSQDEIKSRLEEYYDLEVSVNNHKLKVIAKPKRQNMDWKKSLNISFQVYVPQQVSTDLSTSGGSISLKNISGDQDFSTSGGSLYVEGVSGKTKGRTSGGSIYLKNSKNDLDLSTSGGSIEAVNCTGDLHLSTSGGSLSLEQLNGTINANTSGGNVDGRHIEGELKTHTSGGNVRLTDLLCSLETSTSGGHIDVAIQQPGKYIKISNSGGNIALELPKNAGVDLDIRGRVKISTLNNFSGSSDEDRLNGKLNGGGTPVTVDGGNGRVSLSFK